MIKEQLKKKEPQKLLKETIWGYNHNFSVGELSLKRQKAKSKQEKIENFNWINFNFFYIKWYDKHIIKTKYGGRMYAKIYKTVQNMYRTSSNKFEKHAILKKDIISNYYLGQLKLWGIFLYKIDWQFKKIESYHLLAN